MIFHRHSRIFSSSSSHVIPTLSHVHSPPRTHVVTPPPRCNSPFLPVSFSLSLSLPLFFFTTFSSCLSYPSFYSSLRSPLSFSLCLSLLPSARFGPCRRQPRKRGTTDRKREGREREREEEDENEDGIGGGKMKRGRGRVGKKERRETVGREWIGEKYAAT